MAAIALFAFLYAVFTFAFYRVVRDHYMWDEDTPVLWKVLVIVFWPLTAFALALDALGIV